VHHGIARGACQVRGLSFDFNSVLYLTSTLPSHPNQSGQYFILTTELIGAEAKYTTIDYDTPQRSGVNLIGAEAKYTAGGCDPSQRSSVFMLEGLSVRSSGKFRLLLTLIHIADIRNLEDHAPVLARIVSDVFEVWDDELSLISSALSVITLKLDLAY
jgi:Velvet factor